MSDRGFSLASVILGFFMVAGAVGLVFLGLTVGKVEEPWVSYAITGGGGFLGGWFAARASRGHTVLEPALGALLCAGLFFGAIAASPLGHWLWAAARDQSVIKVAMTAGPLLGGSLVGAFLSEKLLGSSTTSGIPWILYLLLASFGGCLVALFGAGVAGIYHPQAAEHQELVFLGLIGGGCLLSGIAGGATTRRRSLGASFLGGGLGIAAFRLLAFYADQQMTAPGLALVVDQNLWGEVALFGAAGGFVTTVGSLVGWALFGGQS